MIAQTSIEPGAGKFNATLRHLIRIAPPSKQNPMILKPKGTLYVTTKEEIESRDISRLLSTFSLKRQKAELRQLCGCIHFTVGGYDTVEEELFEIPEVRSYFSQAHQAWPSWFFGADVSTDCLRAVAFASIPNLLVRRCNGSVQVQCKESDLVEFFSDSLPATALLHRRVGVTKRIGLQHLRGIATYLGIAPS